MQVKQLVLIVCTEMMQDVRASSCKYSFGLKPEATIFNLNLVSVDVILLREIQRKNIFKSAITGKSCGYMLLV
jgi:hypothetical protein